MKFGSCETWISFKSNKPNIAVLRIPLGQRLTAAPRLNTATMLRVARISLAGSPSTSSRSARAPVQPGRIPHRGPLPTLSSRFLKPEIDLNEDQENQQSHGYHPRARSFLLDPHDLPVRFGYRQTVPARQDFKRACLTIT